MRALAVWWLAAAALAAQTKSVVSVYDLRTKNVSVLAKLEGVYEAPNWSPDGSYLLINSGGKLWKMSVADQKLTEISTGSVSGCNNDHGISPDGKWIVASARGPSGKSQVFILPAEGGEPKLLTPEAPSYYHGWSPDGKWLAFVGQREGRFDLFRVSVDGGAEQRLNDDGAHDDGPDYSPDGKWIYWNSDRTGNFDVWRMPAHQAGAVAEQITRDPGEDWFPHLSPDGKWIALLSFAPGTKGHPANQYVDLRLMETKKGSKPVKIFGLFGGQGTMNVNSWAPDSKRFAFVQYEGNR